MVRASASGQVTGTVPVPSALPVEWADSGGTFVTAAADDRSFIIGVQGGQAPTKTGLDLRLYRFAISAAGKPGHLTELAPAPMRNETTEGIALSPDGKLLAVSLMRDSPADAVGAIQVLDLATGATRTWTAPARSAYIPGPPSWADGSRVIAFTWLRSTQSGLMSAPRGIRLLDTAAPGGNLVAGTVIVPSGMAAAGSIVSALITPGGRDVIVVTWRDLTPQASTHTVIVQFAELQAATGRLVRLLHTRTERYDQVPFTTLQDSLGVLSLGSQDGTPWSRASSSAGLTSAAPTRAGSRRCPRSRPASTSTLPPGNREVIRRLAPSICSRRKPARPICRRTPRTSAVAAPAGHRPMPGALASRAHDTSAPGEPWTCSRGPARNPAMPWTPEIRRSRASAVAAGAARIPPLPGFQG